MARKSKGSGTGDAPRAPKNWHVVGAVALPPRKSDPTSRRSVPEIRLRGAWLERVGFPSGMRYLLSVCLDAGDIILSADAATLARRRARSRRA